MIKRETKNSVKKKENQNEPKESKVEYKGKKRN